MGTTMHMPLQKKKTMYTVLMKRNAFSFALTSNFWEMIANHIKDFMHEAWFYRMYVQKIPKKSPQRWFILILTYTILPPYFTTGFLPLVCIAITVIKFS